MDVSLPKWLKFSFFNLFIVALLGVVMRYKIGFDFPFFNQKHIQHAHSHFAFSGWIAHTIYALMAGTFIKRSYGSISVVPYRWIVYVNLACAYGMLLSFFIQGYGFFSIAFSTLSILIHIVFTWFAVNDMKRIHIPGAAWFKAGLFFGILSSLGTFYLAYMMASHQFNERLYLTAVYFFLHFQYNGFFIFSCLGFLILFLSNTWPDFKPAPSFFTLFVSACIPAYFLSTLWAELPLWLYVIVILAAFIQVYAWLRFILSIFRYKVMGNHFPFFVKFIFTFVAFAFTIKLVLQLGSTVPAISQLAFGFRPIVIAYLHLVLLAVISVFIIGYLYASGFIRDTKTVRIALVIFLSGVFLNEFVLAIQGIASFGYVVIPYVNGLLFTIALILLFGSLILLLAKPIKDADII